MGLGSGGERTSCSPPPFSSTRNRCVFGRKPVGRRSFACTLSSSQRTDINHSPCQKCCRIIIFTLCSQEVRDVSCQSESSCWYLHQRQTLVCRSHREDVSYWTGTDYRCCWLGVSLLFTIAGWQYCPGIGIQLPFAIDILPDINVMT